jgi:hypothetical protein
MGGDHRFKTVDGHDTKARRTLAVADALHNLWVPEDFNNVPPELQTEVAQETDDIVAAVELAVAALEKLVDPSVETWSLVRHLRRRLRWPEAYRRGNHSS